VVPASQSANGDFGFAVPTSTGGAEGSIVCLRHTAKGWNAMPVGVRGAMYGGLAIVGRRLFLPYIAPDTSQRQDINSVFLRRSTDDGATWLDAQLVSRSGAHAAYDVRALASADGVLHLIWRQTLPEGGSVLRHVSSHDDGATFSMPDDVAPPEGFSGLHTALDGRDAVHVIYQDWRGGGESGHLDHIVWNGGWSTPDHLFPWLRSNSADLHVARDGGLLLAFLAQPADAPLASPLRSYYSRWRGSP
jgi:hypothetical protein